MYAAPTMVDVGRRSPSNAIDPGARRLIKESLPVPVSANELPRLGRTSQAAVNP